jgi:crossover junction endodeoxyribonuclease RuvC
MVRILGIDPGLKYTGYGIIESKNNSLSFVATGRIATSDKMDKANRFKFIHENLQIILDKYKPDEIAIENVFVNVNAKSSMTLLEARGAILLSLSMVGKPIAEYASTAIKKAVCGNGRAEKSQVAALVKILLPKADFQSEDSSDSLAVAICHAHSI